MNNMYKVGTKIRLVNSDDDQMPENGTIGVITYVDEEEKAYDVNWLIIEPPFSMDDDDDGIRYWVYPEVDTIEVVTDAEYEKETERVKMHDDAVDAMIDEWVQIEQERIQGDREEMKEYIERRKLNI